MSDPLSIAASVLKEAPKTVQRLVEDVHSVDTALNLVQCVYDRERELLGAGVAENVKTTISSCAQACNLLRADLQRWTRHSEDGKLAWQDRANVGFFKQAQIKAISEQRTARSPLLPLYISVRHSHTTEEIKKMISTNQADVKDAMVTANKQLIVLESKLEELDLSSDDDNLTGSREGRAEILRQLGEEIKAVEVPQKLLNELLPKSQEEAVAKAAANHNTGTTVTFGAQNTGFQAGTINGAISGLSFGAK